MQVAEPPTRTLNEPLTSIRALLHYREGTGAMIKVDLAEVDTGIMPKDFDEFIELLKQSYRQNKTDDNVYKKQSAYVGGWGGSITYCLKGKFKSTTDEWEFDGYIGILDDTFDFDHKKPGERREWAEFATRVFGAVLPGKKHAIRFEGRRYVTVREKWSICEPCKSD